MGPGDTPTNEWFSPEIIGLTFNNDFRNIDMMVTPFTFFMHPSVSFGLVLILPLTEWG